MSKQEEKKVTKVEIMQIAEDFDYSQYMVEEIVKNYPLDYKQLLRAFDQSPVESLRVNTLKITPEKLQKKLEEKRFLLKKTNWCDTGFRVKNSNPQYNIGSSHEYLQGYFYIQSEASMLSSLILSPQPGETVLDMAAAPGGKTTHLAQMMKNEGAIIAIERKASRMQSLKSNTKRCGVTNVIAFPYDGMKLTNDHLGPIKIDKILLDAPCTGSGIIRKDRTRKKSRNGKDVAKMAEIQKQLLKRAIDIVRPGGFILYSTCSIHYQENEQVISEVMHQKKNVEIIEPHFDFGIPGLISIGNIDFGYEMLKTRRVAPHLHDMDGFFYCLLQKNN